MVIDSNAGGINKNRLHSPNLNSPNLSSGKAPSAGEQAAGAPPSAGQGSPSDSVSLSGAAKAMSRLENKIAQGPEVDSAKVEQIKQAINDGSYSPNPSLIAEKMLSE